MEPQLLASAVNHDLEWSATVGKFWRSCDGATTSGLRGDPQLRMVGYDRKSFGHLVMESQLLASITSHDAGKYIDY